MGDVTGVTHCTIDIKYKETKEKRWRGRQQRKDFLMNGGVSEGLRLDGGGEEEVCVCGGGGEMDR